MKKLLFTLVAVALMGLLATSAAANHKCGHKSKACPPTEETPPDPTPPDPAPPSNGGVALGVWNSQAPWSLTGLNTFVAAAGKKPAYVSWHQSFGPSGEAGFPMAASQELNSQGYGQVVTWNPGDYNYGANQPTYSHDAIIRGDHDAYMKQYLTDIKNLGFPVKLRFAHEMNGDWFSWGDHGMNGNTPTKYKQMFQKVANMRSEVGATNIDMVWCPNISATASPKNPMSAFYPGDSYVDWICLDGYNFAEIHGGPSRTFASLFQSSYDEITAITDKPLMIDEYASHETTQGPIKAQFIDGVRTDVPAKYPRIKAMSWFNCNCSDGNFQIQASESATDAYRRLAADPHFGESLP